MLPFTLENKTILITGASSGIGRGIAIACSDAGAKCILVARNEERLKATIAECSGDGHCYECLDVREVDDLLPFVQRLPALDGLVQCAGVSDKHLPLRFVDAEAYDSLMSVNVKAPVLLLAQLDKKKKLNKGASVVLMSSISSIVASPAHSLYCLSKGALTAFARAAAQDLSGKKIRVNTIAPGMVNTPLINYDSMTDEQRQNDIARYPLKRYGEPSDIAWTTVFLLSDASSWVTGQQFVVDGGVTSHVG